jgi:hypothetical protein
MTPASEPSEVAKAAAYAICNGERGAVPAKYMNDIALTLHPFLDAARREALSEASDVCLQHPERCYGLPWDEISYSSQEDIDVVQSLAAERIRALIDRRPA